METTLTIYANNSLNGKHQVIVSDNTVLEGKGIEKCKHVGTINAYMIKFNILEDLKLKYNFIEIE